MKPDGLSAPCAGRSRPTGWSEHHERRRNGKNAFTLVEILAVAAILVLLVALLFPFVQSSMQRAASARCISNLRTLGVGAHSYAADNNGRLPRRIQTTNESGQTQNHPGAQWDAQIAPYVGVDLAVRTDRATVFCCPAAKRYSDPRFALSQNLSYGFNRRFQAAGNTPPPTLASIRDAHTLILIADRELERGSNENYVTRQGASTAIFIDERVTSTARLPYERHAGFINILFADGHVAPRAKIGRTGTGFEPNHPRNARFEIQGPTSPNE